MNIYIDKLIEVFTSKQAKRAYWNFGNAGLALLIVFFSELDLVYAPIVIAFLNFATKEINNKVSK